MQFHRRSPVERTIRLTVAHRETRPPRDMVFETLGLLITKSFENLAAPEATRRAQPATSRRFSSERRGLDLAPADPRASTLRRAHIRASPAAAAPEVRGGWAPWEGKGLSAGARVPGGRAGAGCGARAWGGGSRNQGTGPGLERGHGQEEPE